jgi:hypothetical protein
VLPVVVTVITVVGDAVVAIVAIVRGTVLTAGVYGTGGWRKGQVIEAVFFVEVGEVRVRRIGRRSREGDALGRRIVDGGGRRWALLRSRAPRLMTRGRGSGALKRMCRRGTGVLGSGNRNVVGSGGRNRGAPFGGRTLSRTASGLLLLLLHQVGGSGDGRLCSRDWRLRCGFAPLCQELACGRWSRLGRGSSGDVGLRLRSGPTVGAQTGGGKCWRRRRGIVPTIAATDLRRLCIGLWVRTVALVVSLKRVTAVVDGAKSISKRPFWRE